MISFERYARVLRTPNVGVAFAASILGRLPIGIAAFALVLFVQARTGSLANAGLVSAGYVFGLGSIAPLLGRWIDRVGPKPALFVSSIGYPLALALLVWQVTNAALFWAVVSAVIAGALLPPITVCMRTLLPRLLSEAGTLQTAYSLDSILLETIFIIGPLLVSWFVAHNATSMAVLFAALLGAVGSWIFLTTPAVRTWQIAPPTQRDLFGPLREKKLLRLFAVTLFYAAAFGLFEIGVAALAIHAGKPAFAGAFLMAASVGSAFGALIYGSHDWRWQPIRQFIFALVLMALGLLLMVPVTNLYAFVIVCALGCMPMAPVISIQSVLTSQLAPAESGTESFTWGWSCLLVGLGAGTTIGGVLTEKFSAQASLLAAVGMTLLAAMIARGLFVNSMRENPNA